MKGKIFKYYSFAAAFWMLLLFLCSCGDLPSSHEVHLIDSLNNLSYRNRYVNIALSATYARKAYQACNLYNRGRAEASNNLAFTYFMQMDFEKAERLYANAKSISKNEIELLVADVGLMKIYQRTAMNELFYKRRDAARRRMKRIEQDDHANLKPHDAQRFYYACSDFYITSAIYYYYLRQHSEAVASINAIKARWIAADSCQWMYYHYLKGSAELSSGATMDEQRLNCFDELYTTWRAARRQHVVYFEANGLQSLSDMLSSNEDFLFFKERRSYRSQEMGFAPDSLAALRMAQRAFAQFQRYQDPYQVSGALVSMAKYYNLHGRYKDAYSVLVTALKRLNEHHQKYYHHNNLSEQLLSYAPGDTINRELRWINSERTKTVPEWLLSIREQLSVAYAGMGNKMASDYNRNAYLDILNYTRQDKELENRYKALRGELDTLNIIFILTLIATALLILLLWMFNKYAKKKDVQHTALLRTALAGCRHITTYNAAQAADEMDELSRTDCKNKDDVLMRRVLMPYVAWVIDNRKALLLLSDEHDRLNKEKYLSQQHIAENKRQNIIKKTCLSIVNGINPYLDRIVNEVKKLQSPAYNGDETIRMERLKYIDELVSTINDYNEILTQWIKMRQGAISLSIESFELNELFRLIERGHRAFELKHQSLVVDPTDAVVKADKALTLFMINTLAENARKYTPQGGTIHIKAEVADRYVEISVSDNGCGLSAEDVQRIVGEKVYDSSKIGMAATSTSNTQAVELLRKNKGSGFGLMNCKGIIEKYRKTNSVFDVCLFQIESVLGKGSRFYFRIPKGIRRTMVLLCCIFLPLVLQSCHHEDEMRDKDMAIDSIAKIEKQPGFEVLLNKASHYADQTYYSNVDRQYAKALVYADSAISCLNAHYRKYARHPKYYMSLVGEGTPAEIEWWNRMYDSDFHIILDVRNEAAVAFLALKKIDGYQYNNDAYTSLYKLLGEDKSLGEYCRHLQRLATNKTVELSICFLLILIAVLAYYFFFVRKRIINRMNLEQVFAINEIILNTSLQSTTDGEEVDEDREGSDARADKLMNVGERAMDIPRRIVYALFDAMNELIPIERLGIAVYSKMLKTPAFVCNPDLAALPEDVQKCYEQRKLIHADNRLMLPLLVDTSDGQNCVGVLYLELRPGIDIGNDVLLVQLVADYMAIVVLNSILNLASDYRDIEWVQEDINKVQYEDSLIHVQNMVLDNCLSTIKHETVYYPNKVKQIVSQLIKAPSSTEGKSISEDIRSIDELVAYYRGIFTILHSCAARQLEEVTFRRSTISVDELVDYASSSFRKKTKQISSLELEVHSLSECSIVGDRVLLQFLIDNLIQEALKCSLPGKLTLNVSEVEDFIRFDFIDMRRSFSVEELNKLFYPQMDKMEYLVCRQIIREHDEYAGRRGCRINAEPCAAGGFTIYFTLTKSSTKYGR